MHLFQNTHYNKIFSPLWQVQNKNKVPFSSGCWWGDISFISWLWLTGVRRLCVILGSLSSAHSLNLKPQAWLTLQLLLPFLLFIDSLLFPNPHLCTTFSPGWASITAYSHPPLSSVFSFVLSFISSRSELPAKQSKEPGSQRLPCSPVRLYLYCMHR